MTTRCTERQMCRYIPGDAEKPFYSLQKKTLKNIFVKLRYLQFIIIYEDIFELNMIILNVTFPSPDRQDIP
jgi:hypothetical protein